MTELGCCQGRGGSLLSPLPVLRERVRVRVLPEIESCLRSGAEPSPPPSPGVPGEGGVSRGRGIALAWIGAAVLLALAAAPAAAITLARDRKPQATIVVTKSAIQPAKEDDTAQKVAA